MAAQARTLTLTLTQPSPGMLPSAPTVIVFAREYDQPSATLAALQFLCLLLAVPPANPKPQPQP